VAAAIEALRQVPGAQPIQLHSPHASIGEPSPHGALGIDGGAPAPAPPFELPPPEPPPEPPLDVEPLVPLPVVVLVDAPMSLQYVGSWVQAWLVEVPGVWAATGDVANNNAIRATSFMSKPHSINRSGGDDSGVAPLAYLW
jgi:hypothetical protein